MRQNNNYVLLVFILSGGVSFGAAVLKESALRCIQAFAGGSLDKTVGSHNLACREDVIGFALCSEDVIAINAQPLPQEQAPSHLPFPGAASPFGRS